MRVTLVALLVAIVAIAFGFGLILAFVGGSAPLGVAGFAAALSLGQLTVSVRNAVLDRASANLVVKSAHLGENFAEVDVRVANTGRRPLRIEGLGFAQGRDPGALKHDQWLIRGRFLPNNPDRHSREWPMDLDEAKSDTRWTTVHEIRAAYPGKHLDHVFAETSSGAWMWAKIPADLQLALDRKA